ncbi:dipeptidase [Paludisphaera rhizosphaerae]|uniref:dipeptidase n=2 Tax=Paludisphaera rhizosphaerae TaxID=2711216 RepID=UPI001F0E74F6|nr:membrane dipeptidase [Paludisphaera rhizosphaerae]
MFLKTAGAATILSRRRQADAAEGRAQEADAKLPAGGDPLMASDHPGIARARDEALEVLKPTPAQLQRGLELHRDCLVFDAYGFAPRAAIDGAAMAQAEAEGASDAELNLLRQEMAMTRPALVAQEREEFLNAMKVAGVACIFQNAGEESSDPLVLMKRLAHFTYLGDMMRGGLARATLPEDIEAARAAGRHCLYLTGNGVPLAGHSTSMQADLGFVRLFFQLGIRMMHVTYNRRNLLGDGCAEAANGGLSDFGRAAVKEMNRLGVIVDVAHSGWRTSLEAAQASTKPMVASHTTCAGVHSHIRSKPDEVIRAICDTGGLVGICCIPDFLAGNGDIARLVDHIDYVVKKFGADHVAIGTDAAHESRYAAAENAKVKSRGRRRAPFASLWPEGALGGNWPRARPLAWTNWPLFTVAMVQRGYTDDQIRKILGGNILRVCKDVLVKS